MQPGLALALFISLSLIVGASWSRFGGNENQNKLARIEQLSTSENTGDYEQMINEIVGANTPSKNSTPQTNLIGQKLILDYVNLATNGQATEANIAALASQYIQSIPALNTAEQVSSTELKIVTDTRINFQNYADDLTDIYKEYVESANRIAASSPNLDTLDETFYSSVLDLSSAYAKAASKLKDLPVPNKVVSLHLKLLNSYLLSAEAMKAISETERDSANAFSGLVAINNSIDEEKEILTEIERMLINNAVLFR